MAGQFYLIEYWTNATDPSAAMWPTVFSFPSVAAMRTFIETEVFNQRHTDVVRITARMVSPASHEAVLTGTSKTVPVG